MHIDKLRFGFLRVCVIVPLAGTALMACDSGAGLFSEASELEQQGAWPEAVTRYETLVRRHPDSKRYHDGIVGASRGRIKWAEQLVSGGHYSEADAVLRAAEDLPENSEKRSVALARTGGELVQGVAWERALSLSDKQSALDAIEKVAASGTRAATLAARWLETERPSILEARAHIHCIETPSAECRSTADRLVSLHPESEQLARVQVWRAAFDAAQEQERVERERVESKRRYPLIVKAEKLVSACAASHRRSDAFDACGRRELALTGNPLIAVSRCGDGPSGPDSETLRRELDDVLSELSAEEESMLLRERFDEACERGRYRSRTVRRP